MITAEAPLTLHLPSTWKRFLALLVDGAIMTAPTGLGFLFGVFHVTEHELIFPWIPYIFCLLLVIGFHFFCLKHWSRTPGKMLLGLYITDAQTLKPGLTTKQIALRVLSGFLCLPFNLAPASYALLRADRRQLSDLIAGTQVMQTMPRKKLPKVRWIMGGVLVAYFSVVGVLNFVQTAKTLKFSVDALSMQLPAPAEKPISP